LPGAARNVAHVAAAKPAGAVGQPFVDGIRPVRVQRVG